MVRLLLSPHAPSTCLLGWLLLLRGRAAASVVLVVGGVYGTHARASLRGTSPGVQVGVVARLSSCQDSGIVGGRHHTHTSLPHARHHMLPPTTGASAH